MAEIKYTTVKGRIKILKVFKYKDYPVYIRQVDDSIFEYMLVFNNEIYSSYIVITPKKGKIKLSKKDIGNATVMIATGATTTIDQLLINNSKLN